MLVRQEVRLDKAHRSPDGRWLAFISEETGGYELYVERLDTQERSRVSTDGGGQPRWRGDGKELFFVSGDSKMMVVDFDADLGLRGVARPLFDVPNRANDPEMDQWDLRPRGDRFLFLVPPGVERPIHVVLNWTALLEEN